MLPQRVNTHPLGGGRPRVTDRTCANGIFYVLRTGCQWKALDPRANAPGPPPTCAFRNGVAAGVFLELWRVGLERYDELKGLDWSWLSLDGAMTKSPLDGANRHEMKLVRVTVDSLPVPRPAPTPEHPQGLCLDKGYDFAEVRRTLDEFGFTAHIRSRGRFSQASIKQMQ